MSPESIQGLLLLIGCLMACMVSAIWWFTPEETMEQTLSEQLEDLR